MSNKITNLESEVWNVNNKTMDSEGGVDKVTNIGGKVDNIHNKATSLKHEVKNISDKIINMESDLNSKVETALEWYTAVCVKLGILESKLDSINSKVEQQKVEIRVVKGEK